MFIPTIILCSFVGLLLNLSFSGTVTQPDWCLAVLLGALLSGKYSWALIFPSIGLHDLLLFWTLSITLPYFIFIALLLNAMDERLGPGQPQRWAGLLLGCTPLLMAGVSIASWLMTLMLAVVVWAWLPSQQDRSYVEST